MNCFINCIINRHLFHCLLLLIIAGSNVAYAIDGFVVNAKNRVPIKGAVVRIADQEVRTDEKGHFQIDGQSGAIRINYVKARAQGYLRTSTKIDDLTETITIALTPFQPKALYLTVYGIGNKKIRDNAVRLINETELNALVIDVKGDRGFIPYPSKISEAHDIGAQKIITVPHMPELLAELHAKGIYLIARIVTFKDNLFASAHPELAVHDMHGQLWHDREKLAWADPSMPQVWQYNLAIAEEAAQMGFDEIQFDYVRFPDARGGLKFAQKNTEKNRVASITGFLHAAKQRLADYNVFVSADIFGYVCWNTDDTGIGQHLEEIANELDYVSPMLYPSGFTFGIPGLVKPLSDVNQIVLRSLQSAKRRTGMSGIHFRPWLQAFRDYAFDHRSFGADEIREQINAAEEAGSDGWMLWDPHNDYTDAGLQP